MRGEMFNVNAPGSDAEEAVNRVTALAKDKRDKGLYSDELLKRVQGVPLSEMKDDDLFLKRYLDSLHDSMYVDIGDFEIVERRRRWSWFFVLLKRLIWKLLRFYTYRLWSQQNQVNGLLLSAVEGSIEKNDRKLAEMEARVRQLEQQQGEPAGKGS